MPTNASIIIIRRIFQTMELNSMTIDGYSLIEQSMVENTEQSNALYIAP